MFPTRVHHLLNPSSARLSAHLSARDSACALAIAAAAVAFTADADAATIRVPTDFATIQLAIDNAEPADIVLVAAGTYETELVIPVAVTLRSEDGPATTILTGMGTHRAIDDVTADLTLEGFTIEAGGDGNDVASNDFQGGGVRVLASDLTITIDDCVFSGSKAGQGGGLFSASDVVVTNTEFIGNGNGQEHPTASVGGGAWCGGTASFENCVFRENRASTGAGVMVVSASTFRDCLFQSNSCNGTGGGIGMSQVEFPVSIENCDFVDNWSPRGAGAFVNSSIEMTVRNCTFVDNRGGFGGAGLYVSGNGAFLLEDSEFHGNRVTGARGGAALVMTILRGGATIRNCYFRGNVVDNLASGVGGGAVWMSESANKIPPEFYDCTFVENDASLGSAVLISSNGIGPNTPLFERCLFGFNTRSLPIACGRPGFDPADFLIQCSILTDNEINVACGTQGADVFIVEQDEDLQIFCDNNLDSICADSIAHILGCGIMGGLPDCGGCLTPTETVTWSAVKSRFSR